MTEHFTITYAGKTTETTLGDDGVLRDDAGKTVCGRCGKPVMPAPLWSHARLADCWWGRPEPVSDDAYVAYLRVAPDEIGRAIDAVLAQKHEFLPFEADQTMRLTPRETEQVDAALDTPATVVPELCDAIRRARTDIKTEG